MRAAPTFALLCGSWLLYGLLLASELVGMRTGEGTAVDWSLAWRFSFIGVVLWVPISWGLLLLVERHPLARGNLRTSIALFAAAVLGVVLLRAAWVGMLDPVLHYWYDAPPSWPRLVFDSVRNNAVLAVVVIGLAHAWVYARRAREDQRRIARLQGDLARARLDALAAQLNPHFLFNTLNAIAELLHHDADAAERMLLALSVLLRRSLVRDGEGEVALADELDTLSHYVEIQRLRFGERFDYAQEVAPECLSRPVLALLLQPLVENAVVHGVARMPGACKVRLRIAREGEALRIELRNDTVPRAQRQAGAGVGLANTADRVALMHGAAARFDARDDGTQFVVSLALPWQRAVIQTAADEPRAMPFKAWREAAP